MNPPALLLYDGDCALCAHSVRFLAPRDVAERLIFAAIAGPHGRAHAQAAGLDPDNPATILLIADGRAYGYSDAVLRALSLVKAPWPFIARLARLVPRGLRDGVYDYVARRRTRWFGRACLIPDAAWAARVLD